MSGADVRAAQPRWGLPRRASRSCHLQGWQGRFGEDEEGKPQLPPGEGRALVRNEEGNRSCHCPCYMPMPMPTLHVARGKVDNAYVFDRKTTRF